MFKLNFVVLFNNCKMLNRVYLIVNGINVSFKIANDFCYTSSTKNLKQSVSQTKNKTKTTADRVL